MKPTGIIRRIDDLGRIAIPKELRRMMCGTVDTEGTPIEFFTDRNNNIILKVYRVSENDKA